MKCFIISIKLLSFRHDCETRLCGMIIETWRDRERERASGGVSDREGEEEGGETRKTFYLYRANS